MKVLIVDDSKAMRIIIRRTLQNAGLGGHVFDEASSGDEALVKIQNELPDVVLTDWNMPGMTGLELLEIVQEQNLPVKVGMVTSQSAGEMKEKALQAGAHFLLTKPFTADEFKSVLEPILK